MKRRLDEELVLRSILKTRSEAKRFILEGKVLVNGSTAVKPNLTVTEHDELKLVEEKKFVSRGGYKLDFALNKFNIDVKNLVALDVGASTGGFTDCLIKRGARKVFAVDVGYGQLELSLRENPKVTVIERVNAKYLNKEIISEAPDIVTMDVSFISITKILPALKGLIKDSGLIVSLVKPQFEAGKKESKKGIIKDKEIHYKTLAKLINEIAQIGLYVNTLTYSPVRGGKGNIEFFFKISGMMPVVKLEDVYKIVEEAWEMTV